jgi:hypothetical protein
LPPRNNGNINVGDIVHLKQQANGRTNFNSTDAEETWKAIGNAYRTGADALLWTIAAFHTRKAATVRY